MKNILFSAMPMDEGKSGISNYIFNVLGEMLKENNVTVAALGRDMHLLEKRFPKAKFIVVADRFASPLRNMLWHLFIFPFTIRRSSYDFIFLPAANRRVICISPLFSIGTVHDFSQLHIKGKYDLFRTFYVEKLIPFFLHRLSAVVSVSESTKKDIVSHCGIADDKVTVLYNGYDRSLCNLSFPSDPTATRNKFAFGQEYILYISRIEHPGKNHLNLIKAYERLPASIIEKYALVLAGSDWTGAEKVHEYAKASPLANRIVFTGFVASEDLPHLYRGASLYVFPSFFEGFGIPLIEAMACGAPCACSNCSSLAEIAGSAAMTFDPANPDEISAAIGKILENQALSAELSAKGKERVSIFSWEKHVKGILDIYDSRTKKK